MYRTAPPEPSKPDPLLILPGEGLRGILVGRAVPGDVFSTFGRDAWVTRDPSGDLNGINYSYADDDTYDPDREGNDARPCDFLFEFGLLKAIKLGPYQTGLYTLGGVQVGSKKSTVVEAFGMPEDELKDHHFETLRYFERGIELDLSTDDDDGLLHVSFIRIFRARR